MEYELIFIIPLEQEEKVETIKNELTKIIEDHSGKMLGFTDIGKRKFAYPINHQTHGYYSFCRFTVPERNQIATISKEISVKKKVVRHMIVKASEIGKPITEKTETKAVPEVEIKAEDIKEAVKEQPPLKAGSQQKNETSKIELDELDEKLNEILESTN
jgi:small subunit ribosomal protein S6